MRNLTYQRTLFEMFGLWQTSFTPAAQFAISNRDYITLPEPLKTHFGVSLCVTFDDRCTGTGNTSFSESR